MKTHKEVHAEARKRRERKEIQEQRTACICLLIKTGKTKIVHLFLYKFDGGKDHKEFLS